MPAATFSFRFGTGHLASQTGNFYISNVMSSCLQRQEHLDSVSNQLSVSIYIISANLHAFFLLLSSNYRVCIIEFCVLLHFNQI